MLDRLREAIIAMAGDQAKLIATLARLAQCFVAV